MSRRVVWLLSLTSLLVVGVWVGASSSANYDFVVVAETNDSSVALTNPSTNNSRTTVFLRNGYGVSSFFVNKGTTTSKVFGPIGLAGAHPAINEAGTVALTSVYPPAGGAVYTVRHGVAGLVADPTGPFRTLSSEGLSNDGRTLIHGSLHTGGTALYTAKDGTLTPVAVSGGVFNWVDPGSISSSGLVAYKAGGRRAPVGPPFEGIYATDGTTTWPVDEVQYNNYYSDRPSINGAGQVAFVRVEGSVSGLYVGDGTTSNLIADTTAGFTQIFGPTINERGAVAFMAYLTSGQWGIFTGPDPVADRVIVEGDSLAGSTVTRILLAAPAINSRGDVTFAVFLADGRRAIIRAQPIGAMQ